MIHGEIIVTGTELITGQVADCNALYATRRLYEAGLEVGRITVVGDKAPLIREVLDQALIRSQFIIVTGGLGATEDDVTLPAAALALGRRLVVHVMLGYSVQVLLVLDGLEMAFVVAGV